jgi:catechol 2,3-dioxygenase-like lactoylglutathione lyase family enzyme
MLINNKVKAFIPITNPAKAKAFYQNLLGFKLLGEDSYGLEFDLDNLVLRLSVIESHQPAHYTVLGWKVNDIYAEMAELEAIGIVFEQYNIQDQDERGVWAAPDGTKVAWFKDPCGNVLSIDEKK